MAKTDYQKFQEKGHQILNVSRCSGYNLTKVQIKFVSKEDNLCRVASFDKDGNLIECMLIPTKKENDVFGFSDEKDKIIFINNLRDEFAMRAMHVFISNRDSNDYIAKESYEIANAMLKEREKHLNKQTMENFTIAFIIAFALMTIGILYDGFTNVKRKKKQICMMLEHLEYQIQKR